MSEQQGNERGGDAPAAVSINEAQGVTVESQAAVEQADADRLNDAANPSDGGDRQGD